MYRIRESYKVNIKSIDIAIILITFLCFISMLIFSLISFYKHKENQIELKKNDLQQYTDECKNSIDEYFEHNFNILEYLTSYPEIYNMDWNQQYTFLRDKENRLNFEHFIVVDLEGKGYYVENNKIKDQSRQGFFSDVVNNDRFLTEPYIYAGENKAITTLSVPIYNKGKKVGALCGIINLDKIYKIFEDKVVGNNGYSFLINNNGDYIAHKNNEYIFNYNNFFNDLDNKKNDIQYIKDIVKGDDVKVTEIVLDDKEYCASFAPLGSKNWKLVFVIPQLEFLAGVNDFTIFECMTIIFGILLIILFIKVSFTTIENYKLAHIDSLTNINNRTSIDAMFKRLDYDYKSRITIICFDLNDFKYVNDTYGHDIGDLLLCEFSNIINKTFGNIGFVGRMGGDEFIAILVNRDILEVKYKFKEMDELILKYNNQTTYKINVSYGYAVREIGDNHPLITIYKEADKNMYKFKKEYKQFKNC